MTRTRRCLVVFDASLEESQYWGSVVTALKSLIKNNNNDNSGGRKVVYQSVMMVWYQIRDQRRVTLVRAHRSSNGTSK